MQADNSSTGSEEPPSGNSFQSLKQFRSAGRGFWHDVSDADWNDWRWQLKHRITNAEQLQRLMPMLTPEEFAGAGRADPATAALPVPGPVLFAISAGGDRLADPTGTCGCGVFDLRSDHA